MTTYVNTDCWHYKYYTLVRSWYGSETDEKHVTSLCPYFQTMFWGTMLMLLISPLLVLGWLGSLPFVALGDESFDRSRPTSHKIGNYLLLGFILFLFGAAVVALTCNLSAAWQAIKDALTFIGYVLFYIPVVMWRVTEWTGEGTVRLWNFIVECFSDPIWFQAFLNIAAVTAAGLVATPDKKVNWVMGGWDLTVSAARQSWRVLGFAARQSWRVLGFAARQSWRVLGFAARPITVPTGRFFSETIVSTGGKVIKVLGPLGVLSAMFWAVKNRACPTVKFGNPIDLQGEIYPHLSQENVVERVLSTLRLLTKNASLFRYDCIVVNKDVQKAIFVDHHVELPVTNKPALIRTVADTVGHELRKRKLEESMKPSYDKKPFWQSLFTMHWSNYVAIGVVGWLVWQVAASYDLLKYL